MNSSPVAGVSECTHRHAGTGGVMGIPNNPNQQNACPWQEKYPFPTQSKLEDQKPDITKPHSNPLVMRGCLSHLGLCLTWCPATLVGRCPVPVSAVPVPRKEHGAGAALSVPSCSVPGWGGGTGPACLGIPCSSQPPVAEVASCCQSCQICTCW